MSFNVAFATPTYSQDPYDGYLTSLATTQEVLRLIGIESRRLTLRGNCYVELARNVLVAAFLETPCTHLFCLDDDLEWDAAAVPRMLARDVDIIGGLYPFKIDEESYPAGFVMSSDGYHLGRDGMLEMVMLPGGFLCIKREAILRMIEAYPETRFVGKGLGDREAEMWGLFSCDIEDGKWWGEDVQFCKRWRAIGGQLWAEPDIDFGHCGKKVWRGNWHRFRMKQAAETALRAAE
jgi:hypothetical protein